tara:strand:- start:257 stop:388 length:132 start_codon:yes stop_codon:yes gene_type:complete
LNVEQLQKIPSHFFEALQINVVKKDRYGKNLNLSGERHDKKFI